jgi:glycosyltransferase involved in cell wall biosynthesis
MRVCHIVPSLEDRHGGPSKSVRALANAEASLGASVDLLATVGPGQPPPAAGPDLAAISIFPREAPLRFCRSRALRDHLSLVPCDYLHHHALWLLTLRYACAASRRTGAPLIISPRGMFSDWALQHHRWRKRFAALLVHPGAFAQASGWHATSPAEADDIRRLGFTQPICVAPNGVAVPSGADLAAARAAWLDLVPAARNRPVALFYSRFHRKKRLRELLDLWLAEPRGDWLLLLAGVPEEYTVAEVGRWIAAAGASDRVFVFDGAGRPAPFALASLFLLPSHSENFGLVIAEALASGVPALVSDATPWPELNARQAGWCVAWRDCGPTLAAALKVPAAGLAAMGARGADWMAREFSWARAGTLLLEFYRSLNHDRLRR